MYLLDTNTRLEKSGAMIRERDTQIASIAMANQLILVAHNAKEFARVSQLKVEVRATE